MNDIDNKIYKRAFYSFIIVLLSVLIILNVLGITEFRSALTTAQTDHEKYEAKLFSNFVTSLIVKSDFAKIVDLTAEWGESRKNLLNINLKSDNGYVVAEYKSDLKQSNPSVITDIIKLESGQNYTLQLTYDQTSEIAKLNNITMKLIAVSTIIFVLLSIILWQIFVRIALRPMQQKAQEIESSRDKLIMSEKKAEAANIAKSSFLANMSHEIRTPLNAIVGFTHILQQDNILDEIERKNKLGKIASSAKHLLGVINDILDFSKIEAGKLTLENVEFSLEKVFNNVYSLIDHKAQEKRLEVIFDIDSEIPFSLMGDPLRLGQVLLNFSNNAVKFTDHGIIKLSAKIKSKSEKGIEILFKVTDSGIGITEEQQARLFSAFEQADESTTRKYGGTGLGLVISKYLISLMKGEVSLDSEINKGSVFSFTAFFDLCEKPSLHSQLENPIVNERVLVVDDLEEVIEVHTALLENMKLRVDSASNGKEAIQMVKRAIIENDPYSVVLMDYDMPDMNGLESTRRIRQLSGVNNLSNVLITGFSHAFQNQCGDKACFDAILTKPVTASLLHDTLVQITDKSIKVDNSQLDELPSWKDSDIDILLVEDNALNQEVMTDLLKTVGLKVRIADNGSIGIQMLKEHQPDLIFMDIQMPIMDGYEATKTIRLIDEYKDLIIVAMTANAFEEDKNACLAVGMNDHVAKPVHPKGLYETLLKWLPAPGKTKKNTSIESEEEIKAQLEYLEKITEIDLKQALFYLNGSYKNISKELTRFKNNHANDITQIKEKLEANDFLFASRIAHTLKGVGATLGTKNIQAIAANLENAIDTNSDEIETLIETLEQKHQVLIDQITQYIPSEDNHKNDKTYSKAEINDALDALIQCLKDHDFNSHEILSQHMPMLISQFEISSSPLEQLVENYEFDEALALLEKIKR